jgi:hypothetical protein
MMRPDPSRRACLLTIATAALPSQALGKSDSGKPVG